MYCQFPLLPSLIIKHLFLAQSPRTPLFTCHRIVSKSVKPPSMQHCARRTGRSRSQRSTKTSHLDLRRAIVDQTEQCRVFAVPDDPPTHPPPDPLPGRVTHHWTGIVTAVKISRDKPRVNTQGEHACALGHFGGWPEKREPEHEAASRSNPTAYDASWGHSKALCLSPTRQICRTAALARFAILHQSGKPRMQSYDAKCAFVMQCNGKHMLSYYPAVTNKVRPFANSSTFAAANHHQRHEHKFSRLPYLA